MKKTLEQEINDFLEYWGAEHMSDFLRDIIPLVELYSMHDCDDWIAEAVGEEDERNVRLIRTVYLVSRIAEMHSGRLARIRGSFKDLYRKMEKHGAIEVVR